MNFSFCLCQKLEPKGSHLSQLSSVIGIGIIKFRAGRNVILRETSPSSLIVRVKFDTLLLGSPVWIVLEVFQRDGSSCKGRLTEEQWRGLSCDVAGCKVGVPKNASKALALISGKKQ